MEDDSRLEQIEEDLGIQLTRTVLWGLGALYAAGSFVAGPYLGLSVIANPTLHPDNAAWFGGAVAVGTVLAGLGAGYAHFAVAWGLAEGRRWAWLSTLLIGAVALFQCCPIALVLMWGMLNDRTRGFFARRVVAAVEHGYQELQRVEPP